jgi:hypothetical protein
LAAGPRDGPLAVAGPVPAYSLDAWRLLQEEPPRAGAALNRVRGECLHHLHLFDLRDAVSEELAKGKSVSGSAFAGPLRKPAISR